MQAEVTTALAKQVFFALETLLAGFEAADARADGDLAPPRDRTRRHRSRARRCHQRRCRGSPSPATSSTKPSSPSLLRLVFLLYAEDNALLPTDHPLFAQHYSLYALFERLEAERTRYPDAMDRRYSAWPGLLALFRSLYLGVSHGDPTE